MGENPDQKNSECGHFLCSDFENCSNSNIVSPICIFNPFMNTARFLKYVWPFYNIMHERVKNVTESYPLEHKRYTF